ncbi:hypothetical protein AtNW77_Chr1g0032981 [Arabidopsis thaliana]
MISSFHNLQLVVRYDLCKLFGIFQGYYLVSRAMNRQDPAITINHGCLYPKHGYELKGTQRISPALFVNLEASFMHISV